MTDPSSIEQAINQVNNQSSFIQKVLIDALDWPIDEDIVELEDIAFGWTSNELGVAGLDEKIVDGQIWQLQPLVTKQPWGIFLLEFKNDMPFKRGRGMTVPLRNLLRKLVQKKRQEEDKPFWKRENLLFICTHKYKHFSFAYFKNPKKDKGLSPLAAFGWSPDTPVRTVCEFNLPSLAWPDDGVSNEDWTKQWASAFDIEKVTDKFFNVYKTVFEQVEQLIKGFKGPKSDERKRLFTQRLFNRLMFIAFIQKKGWLKFNKKADYLAELWANYQQNEPDNFYNDRLKLLFFMGLNTPNEVDIIGINRGGLLKDFIGKVPYLNGGLFEKDEDDENKNIIVPDECFPRIFDELFNRFNFTVMESTPLDIEVAVDPEMLGKVFEELVTGRHESGSYYTPKPVVSFMCREALKGYLASSLTKETDKSIEKFVDNHNASGLKNPELALDALRNVKVCDPACGSGAYLVGMLHELLDLRHCLFQAKNIDSKTVYDRKLEIITNNLYGVDIDPFTVNIARLRLWLSLVIDFEDGDPPPLPNLDFKIEVGDSVLGPNPEEAAKRFFQTGFLSKAIMNYQKAKDKYMMANHGVKLTLRKEIDELREQIAQWEHPGEHPGGFDWAVEFAEVFVPKNQTDRRLDDGFGFLNEVDKQGTLTEQVAGEAGGFDIIVANPPYVRQELIKDIKPSLKKTYSGLYQGTADLYYYFYIRSIELLNKDGMLVFISSNKWFRAKYGIKLQEHISKTCHIYSITDFGDLPVFQGATSYPMIFVAKKDSEFKGKTTYTEVNSLDSPYPSVKDVIKDSGEILPAESIISAPWLLANLSTISRIRKMESSGVPLVEYVQGKIYRGILTGFNKAFVIDGAKRAELIAEDPKSIEIIKPLAEGKDIKKWNVNNKKRLIVTPIGIDIDNYPTVLSHLKNWQKELEERWDKGNHWWELRSCDYYSAFEVPKIIWGNLGLRPGFTFYQGPLYIMAPANVIPINDLYLLGLLNSSSSNQYFKDKSIQRSGKYLEFKPVYVKQFPVPKASANDRKAIEKLVQKCLDAKGEGCEEWEKEIDDRVAKLYGL